MREGLMMDDYPLALTVAIERAERFSGGRPIVHRRPSGEVGRTTLGECAARARQLAGALVGLGIGAGDPVATLMWNQPEHVEAYFAIPAMGAVIHTLNPRLHPDELSFIVTDAEDRAIIVDESLLPVFRAFAPARDFAAVIVVRQGSAPLDVGLLDYETLIAAAPPMEYPPAQERAAAAVCYTSGTTGRPKGVVYSHRALVLHSFAGALPDASNVSRRDTVLPVVPMFHANAWGLIYTAALIGCGLVLPGPHLDPVSVLDLLAAERVTITAGVPTVWMAILTALDAEPDRWDLSALRQMLVGGAAPSLHLIEGLDRHGLTVVQGWGMTETSPLGSIGWPDPEAPSHAEGLAAAARQGIAMPFVEVRARTETGSLVPWDDVTMGELEVRGPWIARGYLGGAGADRFSEDGWFATGDVVTIDGRGSLRIRDRAKDLVKSGGEWISSVDLENRLMAHPDVAEAAVIGIPDDRWGERPLAAVVLRPGASADPEALRAHLAVDHARWQLPDRIEFLDEIPRTATGKFRKTALRDRFVIGEP